MNEEIINFDRINAILTSRVSGLQRKVQAQNFPKHIQDMLQNVHQKHLHIQTYLHTIRTSSEIEKSL